MPHDPLSHLAFDISTTTKRLKSHAWHQHAEYNLRSAELVDKREKHDQVKHLGLCISAWTRRLKSDELDQSEQEQRRIAELLHQRKYHKVCGLRVLSSDINGKRKQHDQVKHLGPLFLTGRNASNHTGMSVLKSMLKP